MSRMFGKYLINEIHEAEAGQVKPHLRKSQKSVSAPPELLAAALAQGAGGGQAQGGGGPVQRRERIYSADSYVSVDIGSLISRHFDLFGAGSTASLEAAGV